MNQQEWVEGCQKYYQENDLAPGNPDDGEWNKCHYPVPKCLGGEQTVLLLKEHHAVQGVLQSEEYQHPCVYGWEQKHLKGDLLQVFFTWYSARGKIGGAIRVENLRSQGEGVLEEQCRKGGKLGGASTYAKRTGFFTKLGTEEWIEKSSEAGSKGCKVTNAQRWRCKETGHISTAAGVVRYQSLRGISTSPENRERLK